MPEDGTNTTWSATLAQVPGKALARLNTAGGFLARHGSDPSTRRRVATGALVLAVLYVPWRGVVRVAEGEVGVMVNNVTGSLAVEERVGYRFTVPWMYSFYRLDRRVKLLTMTDEGGGGFQGGDSVKVKTADGSNVSLDLQVSFRLLPERAADVLRNAGPGDAFGDLWVRSAVRAAAAHEFGKLQTEQIYDASARNERAVAVVQGLNDRLAEQGIEIVAVVPQDFHFYKEYEEIIKKKKLADQEVEEQHAIARLATQEAQKEVAAATFGARRRTEAAQGEAERTRATADGYVDRVRLEAEGELSTSLSRAEGLLVVGMAEAEGLKEQARALTGSGGVNLVALEYAKQLQKIQFTGVPVLQEGRVGQYRIHQAGAGDGSADGRTGR